LIDDGAMGRILEVRLRLGHTGPLGPGAAHAGVDEMAVPMSGPERGATWWHQATAGGGALLDYCCYGAMVARWYVGEQASAVLGMRANLASQWGDADDNAALLVRFPRAMAVLEGSWTTWDHGVGGGPIVHGTEGTLVVERGGDGEQVRVERGGGRRMVVACEPLGAGRRNVAEELIHHLETGDALHPTLETGFNVQAMAILDAGLRSASTGRLELVTNAVWEVG
jgi:predicted dehydrogenase